MKKCCLNCEFAKVCDEDLEVGTRSDFNFLICLHSSNIVSATNLNKASGNRLKIEAFVVDDNNVCGLYRPSEGRKIEAEW